MKRFSVALIATSMLMTLVGLGFAKDLSTVGIEEAFIDAVGTCGPSSNVAGSLGKSTDPQVKIELRDALITEAADDAAGVAGANQAHSDCMKKDLSARGYSDDRYGGAAVLRQARLAGPVYQPRHVRQESQPSRRRAEQKVIAHDRLNQRPARSIAERAGAL